MRRLALLAVILAALPLAARPRAVRHPSQLRLMWIGAHPDDEILIAPVLGPMCVERNADCSLLVFTRGENGRCLLPGGCGTLGDIRASEMQRAGAALRARVTQWTFADVTNDVDDTWSAGNRDALVERLANAISTGHPDVVYTFDWHGSTCHPAHQEVYRLVSDALRTLPTPPQLILLETTGTAERFDPATPDATAIDAQNTWHYLVDDAIIHASQFAPDTVETLRNASTKKVWLLPAGTPATWTFGCP